LIGLFTVSDSNRDISVISVDDESFCAVQWKNSNIVCTVLQSTVFKSFKFTRVNDICFVEREGQYRRGKILFIG
jgi:hypothetical protein